MSAKRIGPDSGLPIPQLSESRLSKFWSFVNCAGSSDDCWEWLAGKCKGYGMFWVNDRKYRAPRIAFTIINGQIPTEKIVAHKCDNPGCVNPNHLFLTDSLGNTRDMINKNRRPPRRGEACPNSRLDNNKVLQIRESITIGEHPRSIAMHYGIGVSTVRDIAYNNTWKHI